MTRTEKETRKGKSVIFAWIPTSLKAWLAKECKRRQVSQGAIIAHLLKQLRDE